MTKPVLAVGLLVVMAGAWHLALRPTVGPAPTPARVPAPLTAGIPTAVPTVRLHQLDAQGRSLVPPGEWRNPFSTGVPPTVASSPPGAPGALSPSVPTAMAVPSASSAPAWPRVELIGIAEARDGKGLVRTAIVSGPHGVHHVRPGDVIEQVYRVERIGGGGIDLHLLPEGRTLRFALRP